MPRAGRKALIYKAFLADRLTDTLADTLKKTKNLVFSMVCGLLLKIFKIFSFWGLTYWLCMCYDAITRQATQPANAPTTGTLAGIAPNEHSEVR
jgi:hypothetical protein